jgi:lipoprotein-anchoring transpeptidase ErfK/SrfK
MSLLIKVAAPAVACLLLLGGVGIGLWSYGVTGSAANAYHMKRQALQVALRQASQEGYTSQDLAPITNQAAALDGTQEPWWLPSRPGYYDQLAVRTGGLQTQLQSQLQQLLGKAQSDSGKQVNNVKTAIAQAQQANAADQDVQALQQRLDALARAEGAAHTIKDFRSVDQQGQALAKDAGTLVSQVQAENQAIQQAGQQLAAQAGGNLGAIQQAGNGAVGNGNNDASVAAYLTKENGVKSYDVIQRAYSRLQKFAAMIGSADVNQAAIGTAGVQKMAGTIHDTLYGGLPNKVVIVSFQDQHLWAYENGQLAMENAVTTGIRGVTGYGTDFGPMKVLWRSHPWTMHSPFPKGSPYWYPDTVVQWTTFFTSTGESIHDASWEPDSLLGPGSQYNASTRSHGCIHLPYSKAEWMFNWSVEGMPVIVYPGDGSSVDNQLSMITTNDDGTPKSAGG